MYWGSNRKSVSLSRKNKSPSHSYIVCDASSIGSLGQAIAQNTTSGPVKPEGFLAAVSAPKRSPLPGNVARRRARCAVPTSARCEENWWSNSRLAGGVLPQTPKTVGSFT